MNKYINQYIQNQNFSKLLELLQKIEERKENINENNINERDFYERYTRNLYITKYRRGDISKYELDSIIIRLDELREEINKVKESL